MAVLSAWANVVQPSEASDREWLLSSLLDGSKFSNRSLFNIAFEKEGATGVKRIWIASSDGLHSYDGYHWRRYGKADGLPSDFVRCVLVTGGGQLWIGTDRGAGTFDGKSFVSHGAERGLAGMNVRRIVQDVNGTLWFCSDSWPRANGEGGLASFRKGRWRTWHNRDGLPSDYVVNYFRNSEGRQFAVTSGGLAELHGDRWTTPLATLARPDLNWGSGSVAEAPGVGTMVSTGTDVFVLKNGVWKAFTNTINHEYGITGTRDGKILACGSKGPYQKFFVEWAGRGWKAVSADFPVTHNYVEEVSEAPDGSVYAVGFDCLERWERRGSAWRSYPGLPRPLSADGKGQIWSMDERGFYRYAGGVWHDLGKPYRRLIADPGGSVWAWSQHMLTRWSNGEEATGETVKTGLDTYLSINLDTQGQLWAFGRDRTGQQHLLVFDRSKWTERSIPDGQWIVGAPDPVGGIWYLAHRTEGTDRLIHVNGKCETYPIPSHLRSQYVNFLHADRNGNVWLFGDTGLHRWRRGREPAWESIPNLSGANFMACVEREDELWFIVDGTTGGKSGLVSFSKEHWQSFETDPILSWSITEDRKLLFGSKGRFYIVSPAGRSAPTPVLLPEPEQVVISIVQDHGGTYWFGTPGGILSFHPDKTPPDTGLISFDRQILQGEEYRARVRGYERFRPSGKNLNFWYSWRFDNGSWSAFNPQGERTFPTHGLSSGTHRLQVRSRDNAMNIDPTPLEINFQVHGLPIQERPWFVPVTTGVGLLLLGLTVATTSAHRKLARQARHLESAVLERTAELKQREEDMRQANRVLRRTNEDLQQFAWAASHDLQEPLRMVVTYTQFLARRYSDQLDETGNQFISFAVTGAQRMQTLLQGLLEYWQVNERTNGAAAVTDAKVALGKALGNLQMMIAESGATVSHTHLPTLPVSEAALIQLFQNLIGNAIKYRKAKETPHIHIAAERLGSQEWQFSVQDNGIGIAPEHQELIFRIFKRLNGHQYAGAGIGLAICVKIVEHLGGRLWVESEAGRGSTFYFTVPDGKGSEWSARARTNTRS